MSNEQKSQDQQQGAAEQASSQGQGQQQAQPQGQQSAPQQAAAELDGLANKKPEELTPEELRLMADTMPGEGPGD